MVTNYNKGRPGTIFNRSEYKNNCNVNLCRCSIKSLSLTKTIISSLAAIIIVYAISIRKSRYCFDLHILLLVVQLYKQIKNKKIIFYATTISDREHIVVIRLKIESYFTFI